MSSFLDFYNASKDLILWQFQKSGRQFTDFQKNCKAFFEGKRPPAGSLDSIQARREPEPRGVFPGRREKKQRAGDG